MVARYVIVKTHSNAHDWFNEQKKVDVYGHEPFLSKYPSAQLWIAHYREIAFETYAVAYAVIFIVLFLFGATHTGFEFSENEPSALVQRQGGPCAVIAPVQAFLLKTILLEADQSQSLSCVSNRLIYAVCASKHCAMRRKCVILLHFAAVWHFSVHSIFIFCISIAQVECCRWLFFLCVSLTLRLHLCTAKWFTPTFTIFIVYFAIWTFAVVLQLLLLAFSTLLLHLNLFSAVFIFQLTAEQCKLLLIQAICDILKKCKDDKFRIVTLPVEDTVPSPITTAATPAQESTLNQVPAEASSLSESGANVCAQPHFEW